MARGNAARGVVQAWDTGARGASLAGEFWLAIANRLAHTLSSGWVFISRILAVSLPPQSSPISAPTSACGAVETDPAQWFTKEVYPHGAQLKAYLRGSFPAVRDIDDVVQETYLRVWRRMMLSPVASARSFLYRVARNLAIDALRREAVSPVDHVADLGGVSVLDGRPDAAETACTSEELDLLLKAIERLPPRCREVVVLRKLRGLSPQEIALELGMSEGTVHVHGAKGVRRCEEFLRERGLVGRARA